MRNVKIQWNYVLIVLGMTVLTIIGFLAGRTAEAELGCKPIYDTANKIINECNERIREAQHVPVEFNVSKFLNDSYNDPFSEYLTSSYNGTRR